MSSHKATTENTSGPPGDYLNLQWMLMFWNCHSCEGGKHSACVIFLCIFFYDGISFTTANPRDRIGRKSWMIRWGIGWRAHKSHSLIFGSEKDKKTCEIIQDFLEKWNKSSNKLVAIHQVPPPNNATAFRVKFSNKWGRLHVLCCSAICAGGHCGRKPWSSGWTRPCLQRRSRLLKTWWPSFRRLCPWTKRLCSSMSSISRTPGIGQHSAAFEGSPAWWSRGDSCSLGGGDGPTREVDWLGLDARLQRSSRSNWVLCQTALARGTGQGWDWRAFPEESQMEVQNGCHIVMALSFHLWSFRVGVSIGYMWSTSISLKKNTPLLPKNEKTRNIKSQESFCHADRPILLMSDDSRWDTLTASIEKADHLSITIL